jgi:hypothetical protein
MFLNIVTPCSRPQNLHTISKSINIPKENYRWIVVCDMDTPPDHELIPGNCELYLHRNPHSTVGHAQRNFALDIIYSGHVYMNDDDTIIHHELWGNIKDLDNDFISFSQSFPNGSPRLLGNYIQVGHIDSHNFIVSRELIGEKRWIINKYDADGHFASSLFPQAKNPTFINKTLSIYNSLR